MTTKPYRLTLAQTVCRALPPCIAQSLRNRLYRHEQAQADNFYCGVKAQTGSLLEGTTRDFHFYPFSVHGYYEWRNVAIALALSQPGDCIIEIGANVGTETVSFADVVGAKGRVHAFEPLPANAALLRRAQELSRNRNIVVHQLALSDRSGRLNFVVPPAHASGIGHLANQGETKATEMIEVEVVPLDIMGEQLGRAQLIFMDVEGEEIAVLRGGRKYLQAQHPHLVLEASPKLLRHRGQSLEQLYQLIREEGYTIFQINRLSLQKLEAATAKQTHNWLCLSDNAVHLTTKVNQYLLRCALLPCLQGVNPLSRA